MSLQDLSVLSSEERPITLRLRLDLVLQESIYQGELCWIVKDPLAMKYFRLLEPEQVALKALAKSISVRQLKQLLDRRFPDRNFRIEDIQRLIAQFHQQGLLISAAENQADPLIKRRFKELRQKSIALFSSVLAMRFPGIDPDRFLTWLHPKVRFFFSSWFVFLVCVLCGSALMLILQNLDEFYRRLPGFYQFFGISNLLLMGAILVVTKSLHELGHGLMCKNFGGECHEIGFMLLVLTPAMYCNTSDSWVLPNKWHRIAIGAAGMYVEIILAAICTFIWWYSQPGWIHYLSLNIIFLCSVSTILFNANPLLRYDGYFMLADFLEIPNLAQKSKLSFLNRLRTVCLGMDPVPARYLPQRGQTTFAIYSVASFCYRWFVYISIMWFLTKIFEPYGLEVLGYMMIGFSMIGILVVPAYQLIKFFKTPGRWRQVKKVRFAISLIVFAIIIGLVAGIPVPHHVHCSFVVRPNNANNIFVPVEGILTEIYVKPGQQVAAGDLLVKLENRAMQLELQQLRGQQNSLKFKLDSLEKASRTLVEAARSVGTTRAELDDVSRQIELRELDLAKLEIRAPVDGVVIPPPGIPDEARQTSVNWVRTPLDRENLGALLQPQTLVCIVGNPDDMKAVLAVDQSDVQFLQAGQDAELMLDEYRGERIPGKLRSVSRSQLETLPRELSTTYGGTIGGVQSPDGQEKPQITHFEANIPIAANSRIVHPGFRGTAKIRVGDASLGWRFQRFIRTVFNFR